MTARTASTGVSAATVDELGGDAWGRSTGQAGPGRSRCGSAGCRRQPPRDVSPVDVKRFLDPTVLSTGLSYGFEHTAQLETSSQAHVVSLDVSPDPQHVFFSDIPVRRRSEAGGAQVGLGDVSIGYGFVPYRDLERRFTTVALRVETSIPTGDGDRGIGLGTWAVAPAVGVALNFTDLFPIYATYTYRHSAGSVAEPNPPDRAADAGARLRRSELDVSTVRILPQGFWVLANTDWAVDARDWSLSLGVSGGRAISRHLAWSVSYAEQVGGRKTFDRRWSATLEYLLPWLARTGSADSVHP